MSILLISSVLLGLMVIMTDLLAWFLLTFRSGDEAPEPPQWPTIAVLIAARNEEKDLPRCLRALEKIAYPPERMMVLIGNDKSTDNTLEVALSFCRNNKSWQVLDIREQWGKVKGKANVLAQLARKATPFADYLFFTDADVAVCENWIKGILPFFTPGVGLVNGATLVVGEMPFSKMQRYDWLKGIGLLKAFSLLPGWGRTVTAIGNNMAVCKEAYWAVGGYENIPFSLTEDFELHRQILKKGYTSVQLLAPASKAFTLPLGNWKELLYQRKRWMLGAMQLPWPLITLLSLQALFIPCILVVLFHKPLAGVLLLMAKVLVQMILIRGVAIRMKEKPRFPFLAYEGYSFLLNLSQIIFLLLPIRVKWKDRTY